MSAVNSSKTIPRFEVERVDTPLNRPFSEVCAALEEQAPKADVSAFVPMVSAGWDAKRIERAVEGMVRDLGFVILAKIEQGPLVTRLSKPKKLSLYLIGNPVLANKTYDRHPSVGLHAPLRTLYEDHLCMCHFTYERPSALLERFKNEETQTVARLLDQKMRILASRLTG